MQISRLARSTMISGLAAVVLFGTFGALAPGGARAADDDDPWYLPLVAEVNEDGIGTSSSPIVIDRTFDPDDPRRVEVVPRRVAVGTNLTFRLRAFRPYERVQLRIYRHVTGCPDDRCWDWRYVDTLTMDQFGNSDLEISTQTVEPTHYRACTNSQRSCQEGYAEFQVSRVAPVVGLPYGPDTCRQGYVWREAFAGDHVCVVPSTRSQAAHDNSQAAARRQPGGGAYGPNTCRQGYVWREASPTDHVCVTPATRAQAAYDNSQAAARRLRG